MLKLRKLSVKYKSKNNTQELKIRTIITRENKTQKYEENITRKVIRGT